MNLKTALTYGLGALVYDSLGLAQAKPNVLRVKECRGQGKGSKCKADMTDFNPNAANGEIIQVDLGSGKNYSCRSNGKGHGQCRSTKGVEGDMNTITRNGVVHGSVSVDGDICDIGADAEGNQLVECKPASEYPDEADPEHTHTPTKGKYGEDLEAPSRFRQLVTEPVDAKLKKTSQSLRGSSSAAAHRTLNDDGSVLDVLVVWTRAAECRKSGLAANCYETGQLTAQTEENIKGLIDLAIGETNFAYSESGVLTELRLVHEYRDDTYVEVAGDAFSTALNQITSTNDGIMDDVHTKRTQYGADIVALIIDDPQYCGIAWLGPSKANMFSVTAWNCATGYYSFGHEIGHNMGCNHDKGTSNACTNSNYNYGFRDPNGNFRSILAYNCVSGQCDNNAGGGCTRVQRFSSPNIQYNGSPIGSAQHDNARRINDVRATIAGYEASVPSCIVDTDCSDNDQCTTDVCTSGTCIFNPVQTACCGNDICESGEDNSNCPSDCPCQANEKFVEVLLTTDSYPTETSWTIKNAATNNQVASGSGYSSTNTLYSNTVCVAPAEYTFTINDSYGDGICCSYGSGSYTIKYGGTQVASGGAFGSTESKTFGTIAPTPPPTTASPTTAPPTKMPTPQPTNNPTPPPPTASPTTVPPTKMPTPPPTNDPTTPPTTASPTTAPPTKRPSTSPPTNPLTQVVAEYDSLLGAPKCTSVGSSCTSGTLLDGKGNNIEPNPPNTLDSCTDGPYGSYHGDESIDKITVSAIGGQLQAGGLAEVEAQVWAWSTGAYDTADFYYTDNVNSVPVWTLIGSLPAGGSGLRTLKLEYILPESPVQAVRVNFRYSGSQSSCSGGSWDDVDDLVFSVGSSVAGDKETRKPKPVPDLMPMQSSHCALIGDRKRCDEASVCKWQNANGFGGGKGCYPN